MSGSLSSQLLNDPHLIKKQTHFPLISHPDHPPAEAVPPVSFLASYVETEATRPGHMMRNSGFGETVFRIVTFLGVAQHP